MAKDNVDKLVDEIVDKTVEETIEKLKLEDDEEEDVIFTTNPYPEPGKFQYFVLGFSVCTLIFQIVVLIIKFII